MKIYSEPMADFEWKENVGKPLEFPHYYHLIDCLKELKYDRPPKDQKLLDRWINELKENPDLGKPFK